MNMLDVPRMVWRLDGYAYATNDWLYCGPARLSSSGPATMCFLLAAHIARSSTTANTMNASQAAVNATVRAMNEAKPLM